MPDELSERIIEFVSRRGYQPRKPRALARAMGIEDDQYGAFRQAVKTLARSGRIVLGTKNAITLPESAGMMVGIYRANSRGFGFVTPETPGLHGDLFVPEGCGLDAVTGDTVLARVVRRARRGRRVIHEGRVVEVLQRGESRFVGELCCERGRWFVRPEGKILHGPILIGDPHAKGAQAGENVVVEIVTYPSVNRLAEGVIVERLGRRGQHEVDCVSVLRQFHIPDTFGAEALAEARAVAAGFDPDAAAEGREDLRDQTVITIDPADARDFDDAISVVHLAEGGYELGVHIADVSWFVREGGPLDREARERGNSVYLPRYVVPMLPEILSNGLCSLQEGQARLTKSVFLRYDDEGNVTSARFAETVIRSTQRLSYEQATDILEGRTGGYRPEVVELVRVAERLARRIRERRLREGMLVLDIPEVELVFDEQQRVVGVQTADTSFSHTIIEMFMIEANEAVARLLDRQQVGFLRRVHPEPEPQACDDLAHFLRIAGHRVPKRMDRATMQRLLANVRGRPEAPAVMLAVLRAMERAEYSPRPIGHFALASQQYCHFTSPIRRYPDLTVHRLLGRFLKGTLAGDLAGGVLAGSKELTSLGSHCSFTERRAEDAEREFVTVKLLELLADRCGQEFDGLVSGVANFGVFVQVMPYAIDGLIRVQDLPDDWWDLNERAGCLVGERTGRRIKIGDLVRVQVLGVDLPARQLNLGLVSSAGRSRMAGSKRAKHGRGERSTK